MPTVPDDFLTSMKHIAESQKSLLWKIPKVTRKQKEFKDPFVYVRPWSIPESTGIYLYKQIIARSSKSILELGTSTGYSTCFLAHAAKVNNGHVYTIDRFPQKTQVAKKNFETTALIDTITLYESDINSVLANWNPQIKLDFVFMDADKQYYADYLELLTPHLTKDVCIIVDNAGNFKDRMKRFFEYLEKHNDMWNTTFLDVDNGLLLIEKVK